MYSVYIQQRWLGYCLLAAVAFCFLPVLSFFFFFVILPLVRALFFVTYAVFFVCFFSRMANIQTHADPGHGMQKMILGNKVDIEERAVSGLLR